MNFLHRFGGSVAAAVLFVIFFISAAAWNRYEYEAKNDVRVYSEHGITFATFDADGSRYADYGSFEEISYDGGFAGFITLGIRGDGGRFQIVNKRYYRLVDGVGVEISALPSKISEILERGRWVLKKPVTLAKDVPLEP